MNPCQIGFDLFFSVLAASLRATLALNCRFGLELFAPLPDLSDLRHWLRIAPELRGHFLKTTTHRRWLRFVKNDPGLTTSARGPKTARHHWFRIVNQRQAEQGTDWLRIALKGAMPESADTLRKTALASICKKAQPPTPTGRILRGVTGFDL
jgi:hypothetical protein